MPDPARRPRARWIVVLLACYAVALVAGLGAWPLQDPDEGRYSDIAAGMVRSGDWITPHLNGISYMEKPPLYFWLAAASIRLLGSNELAARLPSALAALALAGLVARWGCRTKGVATAFLATVILITTPLVALLARVAFVDIVLMLCIALALYAAWRALVEPPKGRPASRPWLLGFWGACAAACMVKGPIGVVLPVAACLAWIALTRRGDALRALLHPSGPAVFLALAGPWFVAMSMLHSDYFAAFFLGENLSRLTTGGVYSRDEPLWYYPVCLLVFFVPWNLALPRALSRAWTAGRRGESAEERLHAFLGCAVVAPLAVLFVARSKMAYYLLPIVPPMALLLAEPIRVWLDGERPGPRRRIARTLVGLAVLALAFAGAFAALGVSGTESALRFVEHTMHHRNPAEREVLAGALVSASGPITLLLFILGTTALVARRLVLRDKAEHAVGVWSAGFLVAFGLLPWAIAPAGRLYSAAPMAREIAAVAEPGQPILIFPGYLRGVPFYLGRTVLLWNAYEWEFGHVVPPEEAAGRALQGDREALARLLHEEPSVLILMTNDRNREILTQAAPGELEDLVHDGSYTLLRSRSASAQP